MNWKTIVATDFQCKWCSGDVVGIAAPDGLPGMNRWRCTSCLAMGYRNDPSPKQLARLYQDAWTDPADAGRYAAGGTTAGIAASLVSAFDIHNPGRCLDYGGGRGEVAKALLECGAKEVIGLDPYGDDPSILGVIWVSSVDNLPSDMKFDWILLVEVVEHFLDPVNELRRMKRLLASGGKLAITTPNSHGWRARLEGGKWREAQNPVHVNLFSPRALRACLAQAGFNRTRRSLRPVRYRSGGVPLVLLQTTQILGIDGSIRMLAYTNES